MFVFESYMVGRVESLEFFYWKFQIYILLVLVILIEGECFFNSISRKVLEKVLIRLV